MADISKIKPLGSDTTYNIKDNSAIKEIQKGSANGTIKYALRGTPSTWTSDISIVDLSSYAPKASPALTGTPTAPTADAGTNTTQIATTAFVMNAFTANDAMMFKGTLGASGDSASVTALPDIHNAGWTYRVVTAGTYAGKVCEVGDIIVCVTDGTAANNNHWSVIQNNIDGAVFKGTNAFTDAHIIVADSTAGKVKDSGKTLSTTAPSSSSADTTIPTSKAVWSAISGASGYGKTGTVTNVAASGSGGITISGSPITTSGTITIGLNLSTAINGLGEGTSPAQRNDYAVVQYAGGGTTTTTYHRRKLSNIFAALNSSDITTALGFTPYDASNPDGYTSNTGTVTKVSTGIGLTGGDVTTTGTIKAKLKSETAFTADSAAQTNTASRQYMVGVDKSGYLSVNIPWTDASVSSAANHYTPTADSSSQLSVDASSTTAATWNSTSLVTGVNIQRDAKGHVTGVTVDSIKMPANPNTNTDTLVKQTVKTDNINYKLLATTSASPSSGSAMEATYSANVYANPSTGSVSAVRHTLNVGGTDKAYMVFNSTTNAIDFVFA